MFLSYTNTLYETNVFGCTHQEHNTIDMHDINVQTDFRIVLNNMSWDASYFVGMWHLTRLLGCSLSAQLHHSCDVSVEILMSLLVKGVELTTLFSTVLVKHSHFEILVLTSRIALARV